MNRAFFLFGVLILAAGPAVPQGLDLTRGGPVEITSTDGIEWRQQEQVVIAQGNARAVRAGVTLDAQRLIARYRPRGGQAATPAPTPTAESPLAGGSEIWRIEAEGSVRIQTATDRAAGDRAVYDMDQAVMVLTGRDIWLETSDNRITARDSLEYWAQRRMAVARGNALVVTKDDRCIRADTLVGYFAEEAAPGATPRPAQRRPAPAGGQPAQETGRLEKVEAFGNVEIRTAQEVVRGDRGVYDPNSGMARLLGNVRITRGDNQLNGQEAIVNMQTGVARLVSAPGERVQGLIVPDQEGPRTPETPRRPQQQAGRCL